MLFLVHRWGLLSMSSPGGRGEGTLWGLFYKDANPSRGPHLRPNQLPKATTLSHHTVGEVSACEFGEHKPSGRSRCTFRLQCLQFVSSCMLQQKKGLSSFSHDTTTGKTPTQLNRFSHCPSEDTYTAHTAGHHPTPTGRTYQAPER